MENALQASARESILKQVYTHTQAALCKFPIIDINFLKKKGNYYLFFTFNYQVLIESQNR